MKRIQFMPVALVALTLCAYSTNAQTQDLEKELIEKEKLTWELYKAKKPDELKKHYTSDFKAIVAGQIRNADQDNAGMSDPNLMDLKEYSMSDIHVTFPSKDVAIMTYKLILKGLHKGKKASGNFVSSSVWVNQGGTWKSALYTEEKVKK